LFENNIQYAFPSFRRAALPEFPYFVHQRHHQLHVRLLVDQGGLDLFVIEHLRLVCVQYLITEPYHFAGAGDGLFPL
jgi:hypothetical protein